MEQKSKKQSSGGIDSEVMDKIDKEFSKRNSAIDSKLKSRPKKETPRRETKESSPTEYEDMNTYLILGNEEDEDGQMEIDCLCLRQRGQIQKFISINFSGIDVTKNPPERQDATYNIITREEFMALKNFFAQLDWDKI